LENHQVMKLAALQLVLGYDFSNIRLLEQALMHRSLAKTEAGGSPYNNQRLEFLGDAVLGVVMAEILYKNFPEASEGDLSKRQVALINGQTLTVIASDLRLGEYLQLSASEAAHGGRSNASNLEDMLEAIIGALYLDGGLPAAQQFIAQFWQPRLAQVVEVPKDPKTSLQEWAQARSLPLPEYIVESEQGPAHAPIFVISVTVQGFAPASAQAGNKKLAEREAAAILLAQLPH
jgi:ribonuclease-3